LAPASWYRCDGTVKVTGIAGMDETVIGYLSSAPDARWDPTRKIFRPAHACGWDTAVVAQPPKRAEVPFLVLRIVAYLVQYEAHMIGRYAQRGEFLAYT